MSFIDDIVDLGSRAYTFISGNSVGSQLARTALTAFTLNQVTKSINKSNESAETPKEVDQGVREQVDPDTSYKIPVVYGTAVLGGSVIDARMTNDNQTMWYCIVLCERTGTVFSTATPSVLHFDAVYWNENQINFRSDGYTVASFSDEDGVIDTSPDGLIRVYPFSGNSQSPVSLTNAAAGNTAYAYDIFPEWTSNHTMNELIFAIVRVDYSREKNVTGIGNMQFKLRNTMVQPGDCIFDYMTNPRYGAGIQVEEINSA